MSAHCSLRHSQAASLQITGRQTHLLTDKICIMKVLSRQAQSSHLYPATRGDSRVALETRLCLSASKGVGWRTGSCASRLPSATEKIDPPSVLHLARPRDMEGIEGRTSFRKLEASLAAAQHNSEVSGVIWEKELFSGMCA